MLSLVLIMTMFFGNISVIAADEVFTTAPTTQPGPVETTTSVTGEEEYPDGYWDGYYDGYEDGYEDGTTDYKFVLKKEAAFYNGDETYGVKLVDGEIIGTVLQHDLTADTLYIEAADLGPAVITEDRIIYPGATVTAKTDAKGRLVKYDVNMPVEGSGTGKISLITVTLSVEGYRNEGFTMDYSN